MCSSSRQGSLVLTFLNCSTTMVRELKNIEHDQQRKQILAQKYQSEWQELRYAASLKEGELKDKAAWEQSIKDKRKEIEALTAEMKVRQIFSGCTQPLTSFISL